MAQDPRLSSPQPFRDNNKPRTTYLSTIKSNKSHYTLPAFQATKCLPPTASVSCVPRSPWTRWPSQSPLWLPLNARSVRATAAGLTSCNLLVSSLMIWGMLKRLRILFRDWPPSSEKNRGSRENEILSKRQCNLPHCLLKWMKKGNSSHYVQPHWYCAWVWKASGESNIRQTHVMLFASNHQARQVLISRLGQTYCWAVCGWRRGQSQGGVFDCLVAFFIAFVSNIP